MGFSHHRTLLRHAFIQAFFECGMILLLGLIAFCVLMPVSTAGLPDTSIFNIDYTHDQMKFRFFATNFAAAVNGAALLLGVATGITLFRFVLDKKMSLTFFAIGLSRRKQFFARFLAGTAAIIIVISAPMLLSLAMNIYAFEFTGQMLAHFLYTGMGLLLLGLTGFIISAIACSLAGTVGESLFFSGVLLSAPAILLFGINALMKQLLFGNAYGASTYTGTTEIRQNLLERFAFINPLFFFYEDSKRYSVFYAGANSVSPQNVQWGLLLLWLFVSSVLLLIAVHVFTRQKAENAGIAGLNHEIAFTGAFVFGFGVFALIVHVLAPFNRTTALLAATAGLIACYGLITLMLHRQRRRLVQTVIGLLPQLAAVWAVVIVLLLGGFRFSDFVPDVEELASAEVSYTGSPNYLGGVPRGSSIGKGYYVMSSYDYASPADLEQVTLLHQQIIDAGPSGTGLGGESFAQTVVPYDVVIQYTMKNGKVITRYYDQLSAELLGRMLVLDQTERVREIQQQTITGNTDNTGDAAYFWAAGAYRLGDIYISNPWYTNSSRLELEPDARQQLLEAIAADVAAQSVADRYYPDRLPVGVLLFTRNGEQDSKSYTYLLQNTLVYLTESFSNTIRFLEEEGLSEYLMFDGTIEHIRVQKYDPFAGINAYDMPMSLYFQGYLHQSDEEFIVRQDFGRAFIISDPVQIGELEPLFRNNYFMGEGGYLAAVKIAGFDYYVYSFLPAADAPRFVVDPLR